MLRSSISCNGVGRPADPLPGETAVLPLQLPHVVGRMQDQLVYEQSWEPWRVFQSSCDIPGCCTSMRAEHAGVGELGKQALMFRTPGADLLRTCFAAGGCPSEGRENDTKH